MRLRAPLDTLDDIGQLLDHQLALGDPAAAPVLGEADLLVERLGEQGREVLRALRPASRVAGVAFLETGVAWRLAIADLVIGGRFGVEIRCNFHPRRISESGVDVNLTIVILS